LDKRLYDYFKKFISLLHCALNLIISAIRVSRYDSGPVIDERFQVNQQEEHSDVYQAQEEEVNCDKVIRSFFHRYGIFVAKKTNQDSKSNNGKNQQDPRNDNLPCFFSTM
jgi:hypothetical protein